MKISQTSEMAIHGLWELALSSQNERLLVSEVAKRHNVSESYLAKIFHKLGQAGIVISRRGKVGGFMLAKPADEITVGEIVRVFESDLVPYQRRKPGSIEEINPREKVLNGVLQDVENRVYELLDNVTLADLKKNTGDSESPYLGKRRYTKREGKA